MELIHPNLPNQHGQSWKPSGLMGGTPGTVNSAYSANVAPLILNVTHAPVVPRSVDNINVRAMVIDDRSGAVRVALKYRVDSASPPPFSNVDMFDDGAHGDGAAGDRIYVVTLAPLTNNAIVEFYVETADVDGNVRTWPAPAQEAEDLGGAQIGQMANAMFQVDDGTFDLSAPLYRIIMTAAETQRLADIFNRSPNSDAQVNATLIGQDGTGTETHYLASVRNRGHGSRVATCHPALIRTLITEAWTQQVTSDPM